MLLELYKWEYLCEKGGEVLFEYFSQKISGDKFCLVVEWIFMFLIWQSDNKWNFWYAFREYDYNPWVDIVSWILEGFQKLKVLFKMIIYMYRCIYMIIWKYLKNLLEAFDLCKYNSPKGLKFTKVNNLIDRFHLKEKLKESFIMCDNYYLDSWWI